MDLVVLHGHKIKLIVFRYISTKNEIHFFIIIRKSDSCDHARLAPHPCSRLGLL